jgi:hypothetical protein
MTSLLQKINTLDTKVDGLDSSNLQTQIDTNTNDISTLQTSKQNTLIAGDNITITGDTISSSGGGGTTTANPIAMRVRYDGVSGNSLSVSGGNPLPYGAINFVDGLSFSTSTYKATVLTAGKYFIGFSCYNVSNVSGVVDIRLNDTIIKGRFGERFTYVSIMNGTTILDLVENDTISIVCDNGSVRVLAFTPIPSLESSFFVMFKIT